MSGGAYKVYNDDRDDYVGMNDVNCGQTFPAFRCLSNVRINRKYLRIISID